MQAKFDGHGSDNGSISGDEVGKVAAAGRAYPALWVTNDEPTVEWLQ